MKGYHWLFPKNDSNETEGPNDAGITHFTNNRSANLIRESIQNSLDARKDESKPVLVQIELEELEPNSFAAKELIEALDASIVSNHNDSAHSEQFRKGKELLRRSKKSVKSLSITDCNTTGATDELTLDGKPSKWEALTKSSGLSIKDQLDAGGSFGLGKHAPFAVTDLRTVLYSTAWSSSGQIRHRFQGKTILVSHEDKKGQKYRRTGYLGDENYRPLEDEEVPDCFKLQSPGLAVHIPGYQPEEGWQDKCIASAIKDFFHAIVHKGLEVMIDGKRINSETLNEYRGLLDNDPKTLGFIQASRMEPVATTHITNIGEVSLRILVNDKSQHTGRSLALVRDAGMMITDRPRDMSLSGLGRFPPHWKSFCAIIECRSAGEPSVLRESESPSHNSISTQQISDQGRRRAADTALRELGQWCREQIREFAEPPASDDPFNAQEMAQFLGIIDKEGTETNSGAGTAVELNVTPPQQTNRAPRNTWSRSGNRARTQTTGGTGDNTEPTHKGKKTNRKKKGSSPRDTSVTFSDVRFRQGTRRHTHSIVATFDSIPDTLRNIQLMASVEDGQDVPVGISEAYCGSKKLSVKHNKITSLPPSGSERCSIEILTQIPVRNKSYYLTVGA